MSGGLKSRGNKLFALPFSLHSELGFFGMALKSTISNLLLGTPSLSPPPIFYLILPFSHSKSFFKTILSHPLLPGRGWSLMSKNRLVIRKRDYPNPQWSREKGECSGRDREISPLEQCTNPHTPPPAHLMGDSWKDPALRLLAPIPFPGQSRYGASHGLI